MKFLFVICLIFFLVSCTPRTLPDRLFEVVYIHADETITTHIKARSFVTRNNSVLFFSNNHSVGFFENVVLIRQIKEMKE